MKIKHYLYNSFLIESAENKIAIDPGQYFKLFNFRSLIPESEWNDITHILVTHGDPDHYWQADRVAAASNAAVICGKELTRIENGKTLLIDPRGKELTSWISFNNAYPLNEDEKVTVGDVEIQAIKSVHGPIKVPIFWFNIVKQPGPGERVGLGSTGFKISLSGKTIINLGDSLLLDDWTECKPDLLMLPIGGMGNSTWTMDVAEAIEAVRRIRPKCVIPCHYNIPFLWIKNIAKADDMYFKNEVSKLGVDCQIMKSGDELII